MPEESKSIIWYDDDDRSVYADMPSVASTRDELSLLFGVNQMSASENDEIRVKLKERIVLSPLAAKRFSIVLRHALQKYESDIRMSKADRIIEKNAAIKESPVFPINSCENTKVDLLLGILRQLNLKYGLERSFKIAHKKINENRFLLGFGKDAIQMVCDIGRERIAPHPESNRIRFVKKDALREELPKNFDVVTFKSMPHDWPEEAASHLIKRGTISLIFIVLQRYMKKFLRDFKM